MHASSLTEILTSLVLEDYLLLLSDLEQIIREENRLLKHSGLPPDQAFINRKSRLLPRLEDSLGLLRTGAAFLHPRGTRGELSDAARGFLRDAQTKLHRLLLLDRENEGLLLRCVLYSGGLPAVPLKIAARPLVRRE